jgi:hypothetical protein
MKVYPDHNVMSGIARQDLVEQELDALKKILEWYQASKLDLRISKIHYKELEGYGDQKRREDIKKLLAGYMNVPFVDDQELSGFHYQWTRQGGITYPRHEDDPIAKSLWGVGLDRPDTHHLMLAIRAECDAFLTLDERTILNRREAIEEQFPQIRLLKPTEFKSQAILDKAGKVIWRHRRRK